LRTGKGTFRKNPYRSSTENRRGEIEGEEEKSARKEGRKILCEKEMFLDPKKET